MTPQTIQKTETAYSGRSVWPFWRGPVRCRCSPCRNIGQRPLFERGWSAVIRWAVADAWCRPMRECGRTERFAGQGWSRCWWSCCHYLYWRTRGMNERKTLLIGLNLKDRFVKLSFEKIVWLFDGYSHQPLINLLLFGCWFVLKN